MRKFHTSFPLAGRNASKSTRRQLSRNKDKFSQRRIGERKKGRVVATDGADIWNVTGTTRLTPGRPWTGKAGRGGIPRNIHFMWSKNAITLYRIRSYSEAKGQRKKITMDYLFLYTRQGITFDLFPEINKSRISRGPGKSTNK